MKPTGNNLLVEIIQEHYGEKSQFHLGEVKEVGFGSRDDKGNLIPIPFIKGDKITFLKHSGEYFNDVLRILNVKLATKLTQAAAPAVQAKG